MPPGGRIIGYELEKFIDDDNNYSLDTWFQYNTKLVIGTEQCERCD
jgi:hypothetical protein